MRRGAILLAAAVALVAAAVAVAAPGDPQRVFNAADQARARAILLHSTDLPAKGWKVAKTDFSQANPDCIVKNYSLGALTTTGEAGFTYTLGGGVLQLESDGHVFRSAGEAAQAYAIESKIGLGRCIASYFATGVEKQTKGLTAKIVGVRPVTLRGLAAPARGYAAALLLHYKGKTVPVQIVQINVLHGRELGTLGFIGSGGPWPAAVVRALTGTIAKRL